VLVGIATSDDAGVYRLRDDLALVQTVDFFTPIVDDPFDFGRIAAANALSDVYAMGATPVCALNIAAFPMEALGGEILAQILAGGAAMAREAGVAIVGGHTVDARWRDQRLIAELDGWMFHNTEFDYENDRQRDADNLEAQHATIRITRRRMKREPAKVARQLKSILATRGAA